MIIQVLKRGIFDMKAKVLICLVTIVTLLISACSQKNDVATNKVMSVEESFKLEIYTTIYPVEDFAKKIGGKHVVVKSILPSGSNPHTYEPTSKTMVSVADGDAFIYHGAGMEGYAESIAEALKNEKVSILEASKGIDTLDHTDKHENEENAEHEEQEAHETDEEHNDHGKQEGHGEHSSKTHKEEDSNHSHHGDQDPHIWLDPIRSIQLAENIKNLLVELNPEAETDFEKNFKDLKEKLMQLDQEFHDTLEQQEQNKILVSHAAYGYWEEAYGIKQIAVAGLSPTDEPSQKELEKIIHVAKDHKLSYILFEQNVTSRISKVIQKEVGAETLTLHNVSTLTDEDIENGEDYFSLMRRNLEVLKIALKGK